MVEYDGLEEEDYKKGALFVRFIEAIKENDAKKVLEDHGYVVDSMIWMDAPQVYRFAHISVPEGKEDESRKILEQIDCIWDTGRELSSKGLTKYLSGGGKAGKRRGE